MEPIGKPTEVASANSENIVDECTESPLGKSRYGRTRKPKISEDFCSIDEAFKDSKPAKSPPKVYTKPSPKTTPVRKAASSNAETKKQNEPTVCNSNLTTAIDSLFMPKLILPLPKTPANAKVTPVLSSTGKNVKAIDPPLKERKFFKKTASVPTESSRNLPEAENLEGDMPTIDVTKVLKIIKSSSETPNLPDSAKPSVKPMLKTYGNKRKLAKTDVIESFGLPDNPIIPLTATKSNIPTKVNKKLDIDVPSSNNVNIGDINLPEKPWEMVNIDMQENSKNDCTIVNFDNNFDSFDTTHIKSKEIIVKSVSGKNAENLKPEKNIEEKGATKKLTEVATKTTAYKIKESQRLSHGIKQDVKEKKNNKVNSSKALPNENIVNNKITNEPLESKKSLDKKKSKTLNNKVVSKMPHLPSEHKTKKIAVENKISHAKPKDKSPKEITTNKSKNVQEETEKHEQAEIKSTVSANESKNVQKETEKHELAEIKSTVTNKSPIKKQVKKNKHDTSVKLSPKKLRSSISLVEPTPVSIDLTDIEDVAKVTDHVESHPVTAKEEAKEELGALLDMTQVKRESGDFQVGDLMWAKVGSHPYWPCMITAEPESNVFTKKVCREKIKLYHVRFFADKGRRSWVKSNLVLPFDNEKDLELMLKKLKAEETTFDPSPYIVQSKKLEKWKRGVNEATSLKNKTVQQRLDFFFEMFASKHEKKQKLLGVSHSVKRKRIKRETDSPDSSKSYKISKAAKLALRLSSRMALRRSSPRKSEVELLKPDRAESKELKPKLEPSDSERILRSKIMLGSECSSSDTDSSSKFSIKSSSHQSQVALYKRNYLFKGAIKERVCQICQKPNGVVKCKGQCSGYFHVICCKKIKPDSLVPITEAKDCVNEDKPDNTTMDGNNKEETIEKNAASNVSKSLSTPKQDKPNKNSDTPKSNISEDTSYKRLSLAEQIDIKMKEIMKKFDYKTIYADSTSSDYTSSEESISEKAKQQNSEKDDTQKIQHVTADHIAFVPTEKLVKDTQDIKPDNKGTTSVETLSVASSDDTLSKKDFKCDMCIAKIIPECFICYNEVSRKGSSLRQKCSLHQCGKFYHVECLKQWPQTQWSFGSVSKQKEAHDTFVCPLHVCHTCVSDDPRAALSRCPSDKIVKCLRCPASYHTSNCCVPAGTVILSMSQVICPRHTDEANEKKGKGVKMHKTINTTWCFVCSEGGDLICCETCPTSVHAECLHINLTDDDKFICEDCESGRFPLYDEIVWVKLGAYRWWPALILFPNEVPDNVTCLPHNLGQFVVKFFGTHDHYWVGRGRVFLFEEGDQDQNTSKSKMDAIFKKAVEEATAAHQLKREFKTSKQAERKTSLKPPPYIKIKSNKPLGSVRLVDGNTSNTTSCECDPKQPFPCGPDSDCLNRLLLTECDPEVCPAGERCYNQRFEKREYPPLLPYKTQGRGWGLKALAPIKKGQFVIEYVGEMIDEQEYARRIQKMHEQKEENYYFLTIDKDHMLDAGPKGNVARFMNHSCQPNCETQKWTVCGSTRVGLFATDDIPANTELTFNYNLECVGKEKKICRCGAPNCSGFIGVKAKSEESQKKQKKSLNKLKKKKRSPTPQKATVANDNVCFVCNQTGDVLSCHNKICTKFYHLKCVNLTSWPDGKWVCPWHNCNTCSKRTIRCCVKCVNSYCPAHSEGYVRYDKLLGFVCNEHDPSKESQEIHSHNPNYTKQPEATNLPVVTGEADITSTTADELEAAADDIPKASNAEPVEQNEADFKDLVSSTPLKKRSSSLDAASVTLDKPVEKRKRGRPRKSVDDKKNKEVGAPKPATAIKPVVDNPVPVHNEVKLTSHVPSRHLRTNKSVTDGNSEFEKFLKRQLEFDRALPIRKRSRLRCESTL